VWEISHVQNVDVAIEVVVIIMCDCFQLIASPQLFRKTVAKPLFGLLSRGRYSKTDFHAVREAATSQILEQRARKRADDA